MHLAQEATRAPSQTPGAFRSRGTALPPGHATGDSFALGDDDLDVPLAQRLGRQLSPSVPPAAPASRPSGKPHGAVLLGDLSDDDCDLPPGLSTLARGLPRGGQAPVPGGAPARWPGADGAAGGASAPSSAPPAAAAGGPSRAEAAAARKAAKAAEKLDKAAARQAHRSATGKFAVQQISVLLDTRLASTPLGRAIGDALHAKKFAHAVVVLPIEHSVCWVRHETRDDCWPGPYPWADASAAGAQGATAVPYVLVALEPAVLTQVVTGTGEQQGGLEGLVARVRQAHAGATLCVCTVGLDHYLRAREQREFSAANPVAGFRRAMVDAAMARLVTHLRGVRQRDAKDVEQAGEHVALLTEALAKQPFRSDESFLVLFSGDHKPSRAAQAAAAGASASQAAAAEGDPDEQSAAAAPRAPGMSAWVAALACVPGCSNDSAAAIACAYPSPAALMAAYRAPVRTDKQAKELLKDLVGSGLGAAPAAAAAPAKTRRVGPTCSERMWNLFRPRQRTDPGDEFA